MSLNIRKRTFGNVRTAKLRISLRICAVWSESSVCAFWIVKVSLCRQQRFWSEGVDAQANMSALDAYIRKYVFLRWRWHSPIFRFLWDLWAHCGIFQNGVLLMYTPSFGRLFYYTAAGISEMWRRYNVSPYFTIVQIIFRFLWDLWAHCSLKSLKMEFCSCIR